MLYYFIILYHSFHSCFFRLQKYKFLAISENIANYLQNKNSSSHPRQGVPTTVEALVLCAAVQRSIFYLPFTLNKLNTESNTDKHRFTQQLISLHLCCQGAGKEQRATKEQADSSFLRQLSDSSPLVVR